MAPASQLGTPEKPARCADSGLLIDGWADTDLWDQWQEQRRRDHRSRIPWPAEIFRCPPCARADATPWLTTAGTQHAIVYAGCETAARRAITARLTIRPQWLALIKVRAATAADVARWHQMLADQEAR